MTERDRLTSSVHSLAACILDAQPGFSDRRSTHDPIAFEKALRFVHSREDREEVVRRASVLALDVVVEHGGSAPLLQPEPLLPIPDEVASLYEQDRTDAA